MPNLTTGDLHEHYKSLMAQHRMRERATDWRFFDLALQLNDWMFPCFSQHDLPDWNGLPLDTPAAAQLPFPRWPDYPTVTFEGGRWRTIDETLFIQS